MIASTDLVSDPDRLAAVMRCGLLDAPPDPGLDRLTGMAARLLRSSHAYATLVLPGREYVCNAVAAHGPAPVSQSIPEASSVCHHVVRGDAPLLVADLRTDDRVADLRHLVAQGLIGYAGVPLRSRDGYALGSFCVTTPEARTWTADDVLTLEQLAATATDELERREATLAAAAALRAAATAAAALEDQRVLLGRLSRLVPGVIYQYRLYPDGRSCFPYASDKMEDIYGVTAASVREDATAVFRVLHPEDYDRIVATIGASAGALARWECEYRTVVPSQGVRWRHGVAQPERLEDGSTLWHGVITDVTEQVAQREVQRDLEAQLVHTQKMEAVGTLAGGIAHDFNNLLAGILGNLDVALHDIAEAHPAHQPLADALQACRRGKGLTSQLLALSRKRPSERARLALWSVAEEAWRLARASLPVTIEMRAEVDAPAAQVFADAGQLHQVILNLCTNGAAAMPGSKGVLAMRQHRVTVDAAGAVPTVEPVPAGDYVVLSVGDSGVGMDEATRRRIFEPFFTTRPTGEGTGLGLTMVHAIVKAHGGGIAVTSAPGAGTTVDVYLPEAAPASLAAPAAPADAAPAPMKVAGAGPRVLMIDDEDLVGRTAERLLRRLGCRPTVFRQPREALAWLRADPGRADVVVTDLTMPDLDGQEVTRAIRALRPDLPVVLSSGLVADEIREALAAAGVCAFLGKPYTLQELVAALRDAGVSI